MNYEALKESNTWYDQMIQLRENGVKESGHVGVSCPTCYREIAPALTAMPQQCQCGLRVDPLAVLAVHGLIGISHSINSDIGSVG